MRTLLSLVFVSGLCAGSMEAGATPRDQQPNILLIITDDHRADSLQCWNKAVSGTTESPLGYVESPQIDKLAAEGTLFTNAFCNAPACAPSRGSMHYGQYPHHAGLYGFEQTHQMPEFTRRTIPQILGESGYHTAQIGKSGYYIFRWGPGPTYDFAGHYDFFVHHRWGLASNGFGDTHRDEHNENKAKTGKAGEGLVLRSEIFFYPDGSTDRCVLVRRGGLTAEDIAGMKSLDARHEVVRLYDTSIPGLIVGGESPMPTARTLDGNITNAFRRYLAHPDTEYKTVFGKSVRGPDSSKPLFVHLGYNFPHTPVLPSREFRDRFKHRDYRIPDFDPSELDRLPPQMVKLYQSWKINEMTNAERLQIIRDYYAFCAMGDSLVGEAIDAFKAYSRQTNREWLIVFVCGDHGWHLGENGIEAKFTPYRIANQSAVIMASSDKSKIPAGKVISDFVELVDIAPTIYAAAGIDNPTGKYEFLDGVDLSTLIDGTARPREYVLGELNVVCGPRAYLRSKDFAFSMRTRPHNARPNPKNPPNDRIKWALECPREDAELCLFDLRIDPLEQNNVANDPAYAALADWFRVKLGNIVLGDGRIECDWNQENEYAVSRFAEGADDKELAIPNELIPAPARRS